MSSIEENNERIDYKQEFKEPPIIIALEDPKNNHNAIENIGIVFCFHRIPPEIYYQLTLIKRERSINQN